jgi:ribonuclease P protein component
MQSSETDAGPAPGRQPLGRLTRRAEFQRVSRGRRKTSEAFTLQAARRPEQQNAAQVARVGLTVTKKVGNAVERNRIRRRLREALRAAAPLETREDCDYVLMARREALGRQFDALIEDLRQAFRAIERNEKSGRRSAAANPPKGENSRP